MIHFRQGIQLEEIINETAYDEVFVEVSSKDLLINNSEQAQTSKSFLRHQIRKKSSDMLSDAKTEIIFVFEEKSKIVVAKVRSLEDGMHELNQDGVKLMLKDIECKELLSTTNGDFVIAENTIETPSDFLPSIFKYA